MVAVATYLGAGVGAASPVPAHMAPQQSSHMPIPCSDAGMIGDIIEDKRAKRKNGLPARYRRGRFLGKGGFAKCYEVQDVDTSEVFAAKIVAKASISKPRAHAKLRSEIAIHSSLTHEGVVKFYDYFEDSDYVYMILELCPNQTLNEFMRRRPNKRLSEAEALFYMYDLLICLKYLHKRRVLHRDLKLGNLFLDHDARIKLGDFGLAAQLEHEGEKKRTICGTPNYIAPEIIEGKHGHSYEVDVWSLGVIIYTTLFGRPPFDTQDVKTTYRRIRYNQYNFPEGVQVSNQAKELIGSILRTDPRSRPTLDDILISPWFQGSRLPPPPPTSVVSYANATPRQPGNASARSETPDRGGINFGRIDSPAPRCLLRDRSPSCGLTPNADALTQPFAQNGQNGPASARGITSNKVVGTPGRCPSGGLKTYRPPLAVRSNDENIPPPNGDGYQANKPGSRTGLGQTTGTPCSETAAVPAPPPPRANPSTENSPLMLRSDSNGRFGATAAATGSATTLVRASRPKTASRPGSRNHAGPSVTTAAGGGGSTNSLHNGVGGLGAAGVCMTPGRAQSPVIGTRSRTSSPRQSSTLLGSGRLAPSISSGKENWPAHGLGGAGGDGYGSLHSKTMPAAPLRNAAPTVLSARISTTPDRHFPVATPVAQHCQASTPREGGRASMPLPESYDKPSTGGADAKSTPLQADPQSARLGRNLRQSSPSPFPDSNVQGRFPSSGSASAPGGATGSLPDLWVVKWVDYSSKYGVGYILSDKSIGVYFNDSTKIVLASDGSHFDYITRRTQEKSEVRTTHTFDSYPDDLKKKATLLRHFKNYMLADVFEPKDGATMGESALTAPIRQQREPAPSPTYELGTRPYVKKWTRSQHAMMFQLSNRTVQVVFNDKAETVLSSRSHAVTYVDAQQQLSCYPLSHALEVPHRELATRLQFVKRLLENNSGGRAAETDAAC